MMTIIDPPSGLAGGQPRVPERGERAPARRGGAARAQKASGWVSRRIGEAGTPAKDSGRYASVSVSASPSARNSSTVIRSSSRRPSSSLQQLVTSDVSDRGHPQPPGPIPYVGSWARPHGVSSGTHHPIHELHDERRGSEALDMTTDPAVAFGKRAALRALMRAVEALGRPVEQVRSSGAVHGMSVVLPVPVSHGSSCHLAHGALG